MRTPGPDAVPNELATLAKRFRDVLDRNGYPFQYSALRKLEEISQNPNPFMDGTWVFETAEFPASAGRHDTHIDFVLRHSHQSLYIAVECKRVDPKFSDWCFVKAPYVRRGRTSERLFVETVEIRCHLSGFEPFSYGTAHRYIDEHAYHFGFAVKNIVEEGESRGNERKAIEEAAGQVCKGLNGLVSIMGQRAPVKRSDTGTVVVRIMAAIFTTARLFVSDIDLGAANISTGKLIESLNLKQVPWLYLQYPMSPALRHDLPTGRTERGLSEILDPLYTRSIAIINSDGIEDFFRRFEAFD